MIEGELSAIEARVIGSMGHRFITMQRLHDKVRQLHHTDPRRNALRQVLYALGYGASARRVRLAYQYRNAEPTIRGRQVTFVVVDELASATQRT